MSAYSFSVTFTMTVTTPVATGIPPLAASLVGGVITPFAVLNGLQASVYVTTTGAVNHVYLNFPATVPVDKYPVACVNQERVPLDVSWMKDGALVFTLGFEARLQPGSGDVYNAVHAFLVSFLGSVSSLTFSTPVLVAQ